MKKGLTYLIDHINNVKSVSQDMSPKEFVNHMRVGVISEPEKIGELIDAYRCALDKFRTDLCPELRNQRTLENIATYAIMSDHDYETEMMARAALGGPKLIGFYLENPEEYGEATKALSVHLGVSGKNLKEFVLGNTSLKYN